ncbi:phosphoglycerate dehydrogenase [Cellulomonas sp. zg-ZUI188]|uniref:Phosphoglycerate dehydrogenase n=1 Tax=Cellulomonas fengjieae TaxID=2819978 RepID=A0ABS3SDU8_9CELL|nr:phosphoglycerate dehydrogenase [Cellulomonas fengjieae]QVI64797.1 phosphoglycerate dehydrogenase [Cellulomonas fengjieae]
MVSRVTTLLLPTSMTDDPTTPPDVRVVRYDVTEPVPDDALDADALVLWGNGRDQMADAARRLTRLRWVQTLAAGPDAALAAGFADDVVITSGRGLHDGPVAEHTLALVLAAARRLPDLVRAQSEHRWADELGGMPDPDAGPAFRTLDGARVLVWGFGSIAGRLAPLLTALGAQVTGVATTAGDRGGFPVISTFSLPDHLPQTDVLICLLPATEQTRHAIDADVLDLLPRHAWVVNVGRGTTLDEAALLDALRSDRLAGAALDVFETEPLPADSPLWDEPRVLVSPHAAGGRPIGAGDLVTANLTAFLAGGQLRNVVAR